MAPHRLGLLLLLASCCFSSSEAQLLDWIWGSSKTTGTPVAPSTGATASQLAEASPTLSTPPGTAAQQRDPAAGDPATTQQHQEQDPSTAVPTGQERADGTEQWDRSSAGITAPTSVAWTAAPPSSTPSAHVPAEAPRPAGTGHPDATEPPRRPEGTRVSLQKPAAARPGSAPFPFSPGDGAREQAAPAPDPTRDGASPTPRAADRAGTRGGGPSVAPGPSPAAPSAAPLGGRDPEHGSSQGTGGGGLALAGADGSRSPSAPQQRAAGGVDSRPADTAGAPHFDLLTSTLRLAGGGGEGLASSFPGLMPAAGRCLPLPANLPFCTVLGTDHVRLPNYLSHGSEAEIRAALHEWEGLLESRCHRYLEWFLCLLLVPGCSASVPVTPPPCQGFCEAVRDLCWMHSAGGRLPLPCDSLPEEDGGYSCVFINVSAGNVAGRSLSVCLSSPRPTGPATPGFPVRQGLQLPRLCGRLRRPLAKASFHPASAFPALGCWLLLQS